MHGIGEPVDGVTHLRCFERCSHGVHRVGRCRDVVVAPCEIQLGTDCIEPEVR